MSVVTEEIRAKAEVWCGDEMGQQKTKFFLKEAGLPNGLLPLKNILECGYVEETGFVWVKQKEKIEHKFEKIGDLTSYATEVTAYVEPKKIRKLTGVKVRELLLWITLTDIYVNDPPSDDKISFKSSVGISKTFPVAAFQVAENDGQGGVGVATAKEGAVVEI
ncbi:uncharacterized protein LOC122090955 [Macadamia integrifolia]|uniref:uncharacterized protein LOC122090955 n=1 Tax=Macadamia integrifolia TaxID=60698 RepID=UPI001C4E9826|nr:uncharacterized protein LOC122090955 [Macadamia integrifolia]